MVGSRTVSGRATPRIDAAPPRESTALAWKRSLPPARRERSNRRGIGYFARSAAIYLALFAGMLIAPSWWMRALCLLGLPFAIGALFIIGHDAAHHSLTAARWLNQAIGRLAMLPALHPFTSWSYAHNTLHHGGTCLKGRHPDFTPLSKAEYDSLPAWRQRLERVYRSPLGVGLSYTLDFYRRYLLFPTGDRRSPHPGRLVLDQLLVGTFAVFQLWIAYRLAGAVYESIQARVIYAAIATVVPWTFWIYFMGLVSFVQHTHPRTAWYDDPAEWRFFEVQLHSSTHMVLPGPLGDVLHRIMDHPAHHIDPTIPLYELAVSQQSLEQHAPDESIVERLTVEEFLRICRICKLYDYRRHCWLDFEGRPTSAAAPHLPYASRVARPADVSLPA